MNYTLFDLLGNIGVLLILGSYLLLQLERLPATATSYSLANAVGAGLIIVSLIFNFNLSAFIIEVAWLMISVFGMMRAWRRRNSALL
jgi:hypothetical protein